MIALFPPIYWGQSHQKEQESEIDIASVRKSGVFNVSERTNYSNEIEKNHSHRETRHRDEQKGVYKEEGKIGTIDNAGKKHSEE